MERPIFITMVNYGNILHLFCRSDLLIVPILNVSRESEFPPTIQQCDVNSKIYHNHLRRGNERFLWRVS